MQALWLTDIHLNFIEAERLVRFLDSLEGHKADWVWIGGDIAEADSIGFYLSQIRGKVTSPLYFVLGNHDFYKGSIPGVRQEVGWLCNKDSNLCWLSDAGIIELSSSTALIGHDSWADGRFGDYWNSDLMLTDYFIIQEFNSWMVESKHRDVNLEEGTKRFMEIFSGEEAKRRRLETMQALADEAVDHVERYLPRALERFQHVYFLTHVPPFKEACWHRGRISDDNGLPHFASQAVGDALRRIMEQYPQRRLTVLCGHTHSGAHAQVRDNLTVYAGHAVYGMPDIQILFDV